MTRRRLRMTAGLLLATAAAILLYEVTHWLTHVYESDARVRTELIRMSSRVDGTIERIEVDEGDRVAAGDLLVVLAHDEIELNIETLQADLLLEAAERARLQSERNALESELESRLGIRREQIEAGQVEHRAVLDRLRLAERDLERVNVLFERKISSEKDLALEQDRVLILRGDAARAAARIEIARREMDQVTSSRRQLDVIDDRIAISKITTARIEKTIEHEQISLGFRHVRSPVDAVIDRVYKHEGEYVEEGEPILILHDESIFWVEANIEENQIRHLRVGQKVAIHLEARPFDEYSGTLSSIGSATTLQMGIEANAGSRFGRAAQRVPVRIVFDTPPGNLVPGMLAKINVRIRPSLGSRSVFDLLRRAHAP